MWKQDLSESFVRGIGNTSATLVVLGMVSFVWFLVNNGGKSNSETQTYESVIEEESDASSGKFRHMFDEM
jgi:hypothetical protein